MEQIKEESGFDFPFYLTCRENSWSRTVKKVEPTKRGRPDPSDYRYARSRIVFFIHGYNTSYGEATESFDDFWNNYLYEKLTDQEKGDCLFFFWPGNRKWWPLIRSFYYPWPIEKAYETALELASYTKKLKSINKYEPLRLQFVAHSLGCRVTLETLKMLKQESLTHIVIEKVILMAPAVPVGDCELPSGYFVEQLSKYTETVLYSSKDKILSLSFPLGERIGSLVSDLDIEKNYNWKMRRAWEAVGKAGNPKSRWSKESEDTKLSHGDYWKNETSLNKILEMINPNKKKNRELNSRRLDWRSLGE